MQLSLGLLRTVDGGWNVVDIVQRPLPIRIVLQEQLERSVANLTDGRLPEPDKIQ